MKKFLLFYILIAIFAGSADAQDFTASAKTDGGETAFKHRFKTNVRDFTFEIANTLPAEASLELRLVSGDDIEKSGYTILEEFPIRVNPSGNKTLHFSANYNRWIKEETRIYIDVYKVPSPVIGGEKKKIHRLAFTFSAEGKLQFYNPRYMKLSGWLPPVELSTRSEDSREKIIEFRRIGSEAVTVRLQINSDFRSAFKLFTNEKQSRQLFNGDTITVAGGGKSLIIQYHPPKTGEIAWMDTAAVTITSVNNSANRLVLELKGSAGEGQIVNIETPPEFDPNKVKYGEPAPIPIKFDSSNNPYHIYNMSMTDSLARVKFILDSLRWDSIRRIAIPKIQDFMARYRMVDFVHDSVLAIFRQDSGVYSSKIPLEFQKIEKGRMGLVPGRMILNPGEKQIQLKVNEYFYDTLGGHIILSMPDTLSVTLRDTLPLVMRFVPYYVTEDKDTFFPIEEEYRMKTETPAAVFPAPNTLLYILIGLGIVLLVILFLIRRRLGRPVTDLSYLKDLQYQALRSAGDSKSRIECSAIEVDLNKHLDLVQLEFPGMLLKATVPPPEQSRFRRIMRMIFLLPRKQRFRAYYFSLRVDPVYDRLPDELELKDEEGLFLLESDMTQEILATDHQDFILTDEEINYILYLDASEILYFDGPAKIIKIQFSVTEEPFEGYTKYTHYIVPIKITPKRVTA